MLLLARRIDGNPRGWTHLKALLDFRGRVRAVIMLVLLPERLQPLLLSPLLLQLLLLLPELRKANCVSRKNFSFLHKILRGAFEPLVRTVKTTEALSVSLSFSPMPNGDYSRARKGNPIRRDLAITIVLHSVSLQPDIWILSPPGVPRFNWFNAARAIYLRRLSHHHHRRRLQMMHTMRPDGSA